MIQALKTVLPVKDKVRAKEKRLIFLPGRKRMHRSFWKNWKAVALKLVKDF